MHKRDKIIIRPYQPNDAQSMCELVYDNAFLGEPFNDVFTNKKWFSDVVIAPYILHQPEQIYVAVDTNTNQLVGYLTGSTQGDVFEEIQYRIVRKKVVALTASVNMPWNIFNITDKKFATHLVLNGEKERPDHPPNGVHWHYQVNRKYRGKGIGTSLLCQFVNDVDKDTFKIIWAEVMSYPNKPRSYFEADGWDIYDAKPTKIFRDLVDFPVEVLCIVNPITAIC